MYDLKKLLDNYLAKSDPPITISQHIKDLKDRFKQLEPYLPKDKVDNYRDIIYKLLEYHDLGKINKKFQDKVNGIKKHKDEIPHEWLSVAFIDDEFEEWLDNFIYGNVDFYKLFVYIIANHHNRIGKIEYFSDSKEKFEKIAESLKDVPYYDNFDPDDIKNINKSINDNFSDYFADLVFLKGILHKCDYSASANIPSEIYYNGNYQEDFKKGLEFQLKPFQAEAKNLSDKNVVLIASTGMGKTEYSMNWINGGKAFYLLGIRMATDSIYKRFKKFFGDNVALLHGNINYSLLEELEEEQNNKKTNKYDYEILDNKYEKIDYETKLSQVRQLAYPITVATADQIVTSVFKYKFEMHYLTASYSKIVVDEIQSFSPGAMAAIVVFLQEISKLGGKFLLMSATIPKFVKDDLKSYTDADGIREPQLLDKQRHKIEVKDCFIEDYDFSKIDFKNKKILIICNTVKKAQLLYEKLNAMKLEPNLLHSHFIKLDRENKEKAILEFEKSNNSGIWITTQIVEASLDIDFDLLLTECSTIDSMLQRFGRCYRKRDYSDDKEPNIIIFKYYNDNDNESKVYDVILTKKTYEIFSNTKYNKTLLTEEQKQEMINEVFNAIEDTNYYNDYKRCKLLLKNGFRAENKAEVQELFRGIASQRLVIPRSVYNEYKDKILENIEITKNKNKSKESKLKAEQEILKYCTQLPYYNKNEDEYRDKLFNIGIDSSFVKSNGIKIIDGISYDDKKGLVLE